MRELFQRLCTRMEQGLDTVMVTVISSEGAVPRGPGARMLVGEDGLIYGTIGGGMVEYQSEQSALELLGSDHSITRNFCLDPNGVENLGMVCGGALDVWFLPVHSSDQAIYRTLEAMEQFWQKGESFWILCDLEHDKVGTYGKCSGSFGMDIPAGIIGCLRSKARVLTNEHGTYFCQQLLSAGKVYLFGGGHVARALVPELERLNFRCVVVEDREEFLLREHFTPNTELICRPVNAMDDLMARIGPEDMICVMTRGHKNDYEVQMQALTTPAKYIGVIGSKAKHRFVRTKALEAGYSEHDLERIVAPIGLDISSDTPEEIAVSIAAQLIMVRANRARSDWSK